jgi:RNA recognition motif-containing protein
MADPVSVNAAPVVDSGAVPTPAIDEQPGHKVFTGNLAYTTTDEGLKSFFAPVAEDILSAQVIFRGTRSAGYGFVAFNTAEAAQKAVDLLNKKELDGRTLIVEVAKPTEEKQKEKKEKRTPKKRPSKKSKTSTDEADAVNGTADATEAKDTAEKGEIAGDAKPKKKRNARKTKKSKTDAKEGDAAASSDAAATPAEPKPKKVKTPKAKVPRPVRPIGEAPEGEPSKTMLFVANLGFTVDDAALSELFTSAGITVTSARVVRRRWGQPRRSKGYGFVDVGSEDEQKKALELLQGKEVGGREIAVKIAVNAQEHELNGEEASGPGGVVAAAS